MSSTPKKEYLDQKYHAQDRDIDWNISYEEWLEIWLISGMYKNRGREKGNYQMCRRYDEGAYSPTNCYIATVEQNQKERHKIPEGETGNILTDWLSGQWNQYELAEMYNKSQSCISRIVNRKRRTDANYT